MSRKGRRLAGGAAVVSVRVGFPVWPSLHIFPSAVDHKNVLFFFVIVLNIYFFRFFFTRSSFFFSLFNTMSFCLVFVPLSSPEGRKTLFRSKRENITSPLVRFKIRLIPSPVAVDQFRHVPSPVTHLPLLTFVRTWFLKMGLHKSISV